MKKKISLGSHYLKKYDILRTLEKYSGEKGDNKKEHKPDIKEVLIENTIQFKKDLIDIVENKDIINDENFEKIFNKLFELPVKYSFNKFKGLVKEVSQALGKKVEFQLDGVEGSLSKEKLQSLHEAVIHLIRNSLDHGIERPEIRLNKGKDAEGRIEVYFYKSKKDDLVIKIKDDGQGIDIKRLVEKAISNNILRDEDIDKMTEKEKIDLIFEPNLSTKEKSQKFLVVELVWTLLRKF